MFNNHILLASQDYALVSLDHVLVSQDMCLQVSIVLENREGRERKREGDRGGELLGCS